MKYIFCSIILLGMGVSLNAQNALHLRFRPEQSASSFYQPAYLANEDSSRFEFGSEVFNNLESNTLARENIFLSGLELDDAIKARILADLGENNQLRLGIGGKAMLSFKTKGGLPISLHYGIKQEVYANVPNANTIGLALYGNKRYEGEVISDRGVKAVVSNFHEIGIGSSASWDGLHIGGRVKYLMGTSGTFLSQLEYSLLTDTLGTAITANGTYDALLSGRNGLGGIGMALDLGVVFEINEKFTIQASFLDLGYINWNGDQLANNFSIDYEGEQILDLNTFLDAQSLEGPGELLDQILPDTVENNELIPINSTYHLGFEFSPTVNDHIQLSVLGSIQSSGTGGGTPIANLSYQRAIFKEFFLGVNGFVGGLDGLGVGAMASGNIPFGKNEVNLFFQSPNLLGLLSPENYGGSMLSFGLGYRLIK
ncbi:MAG: DUF5723 family protein [Bacteroidia bacterium]|nr:DUF5723 family protein [Bacteroidia bacterium]